MQGKTTTKKYELTNECIEKGGVKLHRIKALKKFGNVKAGDLGGYVQSEENLSQDGKSWISDKAAVYDHAKVIGNAAVREKAQVTNLAVIKDSADVSGTAWICESAVIGGKMKIDGDAFIFATPDSKQKTAGKRGTKSTTK